MNTERQPTLPDLYPPPEGSKVRERTFGASPVSPPVSAPIGRDAADPAAPRLPFKSRWENQLQEDSGGRKIKITVRERDNGHLIADVFCNDAELLGKASVSVGLVGARADRTIRMSVALDVPATDGCSGSADFGPLADAVEELGGQLRVVMFLLV